MEDNVAMRRRRTVMVTDRRQHRQRVCNGGAWAKSWQEGGLRVKVPRYPLSARVAGYVDP